MEEVYMVWGIRGGDKQIEERGNTIRVHNTNKKMEKREE